MRMKRWTSNQTLEYWKNIEGYEGKYQISNLGRVKSVDRFSWNGRVWWQLKGRILKPQKHNGGYLTITLTEGKKQKQFLIHRLVVENFIGDIPKGYEIDHINTIKTDNRLENLRIVKPIENMNNPLTRKHISKSKKGKQTGEKNPRSKHFIIIYDSGLMVYKGTLEETCKYLNMNKITIFKIVNGQNTYKGKEINYRVLEVM